MIKILCDGRAVGQEGQWKGSWAYIVVDEEGEMITQKADIATGTFNAMEWRAVVEALEYCLLNDFEPSDVLILTDSQLVIDQLYLASACKSKNLLNYWQKARTMIEKKDVKVVKGDDIEVRKAHNLALTVWQLKWL